MSSSYKSHQRSAIKKKLGQTLLEFPLVGLILPTTTRRLSFSDVTTPSGCRYWIPGATWVEMTEVERNYYNKHFNHTR
jgi:hypothetical protein